MSLADQPLPEGRADHPIGMTTTQAFDDKPEFPLSTATTFDEPIFDKFDDMDNQDTMAPSPNLGNDDAPKLPARSALRASRMLDNLGLKVGGTVESTTPHDVYLSSEEDASSDADDFSDYDYDSSVDDPTSPTRTSHEVTARAVSVVFSGKPSIVDLPATRRRPTSSSSLGTTRTQSSTELPPAKPLTTRSATTEERPGTPASTTSSRRSRLSKEPPANRKSMLLSEILTKKRPPFLSIDPYANGSTYSLDIPKALDSLEGETQPVKTPRTPTTLLKGVTRSFSLARRRSRPNLNSPQTAIPKLDTSFATTSNNRNSVMSPAMVHRVDEEPQQGKPESEQEQQQQQTQQPQLHRPDQRPKTPVTPITYTDILRSVKRNATVMGAASPPSDIMSPTSPAGPSPATARKGILSGLSARRRSVKLMGKP
ncbi:uncharacterized protein B0H64DRAFT_392317 [Chaetomium fimeti]|uniref:Uncharacterized protein n=1 Tax=Chaetomium fimeti TaxID=1854472 RepID=A0AAE0HJ74_9PEZI|nr:hypothetical protein B0H64DRAFT_392317 [Chaetomium fimeti]